MLSSLFLIAEDNAAEQKSEDSYENGCSNDLDDDMDGDIDADDDDCSKGVIFASSDFDSESLRPYLVWGVGIALLGSVESSSSTGTATTD